MITALVDFDNFLCFSAMDTDRQSNRVHQSSQPPSRDRTPARSTAAVASASTPVSSLPPLTQDEIDRKAKLIAEEFICNKNFEVSR